MRSKLSLKAPAKINLHLRVGPPRPDGFHSIASVFQAISLADTVSVSLVGAGGRIELRCDADCPPERNTMFRAASLYLRQAERAGLRAPSLLIEADKRIPAGAGLGGGSSDAAAVLKALEILLPGATDGEGLRAMAAQVGSDVPFFLGQACQAVRGRGELVRPVPARADYALALIHPGLSVSTKEAYAALDASRSPGAAPSEEALDEELAGCVRAYAELQPAAWRFSNDFYEPVAASRPALVDAFGALRATEPDFCAMTGSGSCLFGVYGRLKDAEAALASLKALGYGAWLAFPLARFPKPD